MTDLMNAVPFVHPETGVQRVGDRLLAAGPSDELHVFEDEQGHISEVGQRIVELVNGERSLAQIAECLCQEFEVEPAHCQADVLAFVELLVEKKVLGLASLESKVIPQQ